MGSTISLKKLDALFRLEYKDIVQVEYYAPARLRKGKLIVHLRNLPTYQLFFEFPVTKSNAEICEKICGLINQNI